MRGIPEGWIVSEMTRSLHCGKKGCDFFISAFQIQTAYDAGMEINRLTEAHNLTHLPKPRVSMRGKRIWRARLKMRGVSA